MLEEYSAHKYIPVTTQTYKREAAVSAPAYNGLVYVDEDSRVAKRASTTVTGDLSTLHPPDWLLVDEVDGRVWSWLNPINKAPL